MIRIFSIGQAQRQLGKILNFVSEGERVQISIEGSPVVEIIPVTQPKKRPLLGEFEPFDIELTPELLAPLYSQGEWEEILAERDRKFLSCVSEMEQEKESK